MDTRLQKNHAGYSCDGKGKRKRQPTEKTELIETNGLRITDLEDGRVSASMRNASEVNHGHRTNFMSKFPMVAAASTEIGPEVGEDNSENELLKQTKKVNVNGEGQITWRGTNRDEIQQKWPIDSTSNVDLSEGNDCRKVDCKLTDCITQVSLPGYHRNMKDPGAFPKDRNVILLPEMVDISGKRDSSGLIENREKWLISPLKVERKSFPCYNLHIPYTDQNAVRENSLNHTEDRTGSYTGFYTRKFSYDDRSCLSGYSSRNMNVVSPKGLYHHPRIPRAIFVRRKLLVLDINGLLADIMMPAPHDCTGDAKILGRTIFRRPFCDDFLKFCFQNFYVGVWSSRSKKIIDAVIPYLFENLEARLLFRWDMSQSTLSGFNTLEKPDKPLVFKEMRKIWEDDDPYLPWKREQYNESNTLLLDDSPYKALLNPEHTAIFPPSYSYEDKNDKSLGPDGDLRVYLEELLAAEHVPKYVMEHPFGQRGIDENNKDWRFYSMVVQSFKFEQKIIRRQRQLRTHLLFERRSDNVPAKASTGQQVSDRVYQRRNKTAKQD